MRDSSDQVKLMSESSDGVFNYKNFEILVPNNGTYYAEFWLLPSRLSDSSYSLYYVYVNNTYVGEILPTKSNWQSIRINGEDRIYLNSGSNIISVAAMSPEIPNVETIKVSLNSSEATIQSEDYNNYLAKAKEGELDTVSSIIEESIIESNESSSASVAFFANVPLKYTFYNKFSLTKDQDIFITSSSDIAHDIDVIYYGELILPPPLPDEEDTSDISITDSDVTETQSKRPPVTKKVPDLPMIYATSAEMQGLNWKNESEQVVNSTKQVATVRMTVPKTGYYLVRLRSHENGVLGTADLNFNGTYYYEDATIYHTSLSCVIPADGNEYTTLTNCYNPGTDDPMIFILGAASERIVGYNDDGASAIISEYNLDKRDAVITQKYNMPTSNITVSNYSSSAPESSCSILARISSAVDEDAISTIMRSKTNQITSVIDELKESTSNVNILGTFNLGSMLYLNSDNIIQDVMAYDIMGAEIGHIKCEKKCLELSTSSLNINKIGIYIIRVLTDVGSITKKIVIK
jgi:hypothetical protein